MPFVLRLPQATVEVEAEYLGLLPGWAAQCPPGDPPVAPVIPSGPAAEQYTVTPAPDYRVALIGAPADVPDEGPPADPAQQWVSQPRGGRPRKPAPEPEPEDELDFSEPVPQGVAV